jgi:hypothetical protein
MLGYSVRTQTTEEKDPESVTNIEPAKRLPRINESARRDCLSVSKNLLGDRGSWTVSSADAPE